MLNPVMFNSIAEPPSHQVSKKGVSDRRHTFSSIQLGPDIDRVFNADLKTMVIGL